MYSKPERRTRPRRPAWQVYAPGLVVFAIGVVVLLAFPVEGPIGCTCPSQPNGSVCTCPSAGYVLDPVGPILIASAGGYCLIEFVLRGIRSR